jgi:protein gp37
MSDKTQIEWTDATWNPIRGCSRVSDGCRHCYAEGQAARIILMDRGKGVAEGNGAYDGLLAKGGQWNGKIKVVPEVMDQPLRWKKPRAIFVNSMSDLFHENVPTDVIDHVFAIMAIAPQHTFQILTKRPERMLEYMKGLEAAAEAWAPVTQNGVFTAANVLNIRYMSRQIGATGFPQVAWPLPNVWIGVSVENQDTARERIPQLLETPAAVRWLSMEPLLGPVDISEWLGAGIGWVVAGGESGPLARPMHPQWPRDIRDQCQAAGVPFLMKQWGEWVNPADGPTEGVNYASVQRKAHVNIDGTAFDALDTKAKDNAVDMYRLGKRQTGRLIDGVMHDAYPAAAQSIAN